MAYSDNFPAVRPVFQADFANGGRIDPRATFSRASTANVFDGAKHLSSENLIAYSNLSSGFSFARTTLASTNNSAPDGGSDAASILETADTGLHDVSESIGGCVSGTQYSFVFYLKANGRTKAVFKPQLTSVIAEVTFDLTAATSTVSSGSADSHSITAIGSTGWYKCAVTVTATGTGTGYTQFNLLDGSSSESYAGDVTKGMYVWGASVSSTGETVLNETSGQIHREYASTLVSKANNAARFETATDGQSMGCLIESQATNLVTHSHELDNAGWTKGALNIDANAAISVDGTLTADLLRPTTALATHTALTAVTTTASSTYTVSAYVKAAGYSKVQLYFYESSSPNTTQAYTIFHLSGSGSATTSVGSSTITAVGGGYYRVSVTGVSASSGSSIQIRPVNDAGTQTFAGDGYSGIICTGVQCELGSHCSSLVSTSGASATRAADSLSVATADIPGYSEGVGTIVCETGGVASSTETNQIAFGLNGPASNNIFTAGVNNGGVTDSTVRVYSQTPDGDQAFLNPGTATVGTGYKLACRYELDNIAASMNGGAVVSDTNGKVPVGIDTLWVGELEGNYQLNSTIKRIAVYNEALSDTNLQSLTAS